MNVNVFLSLNFRPQNYVGTQHVLILFSTFASKIKTFKTHPLRLSNQYNTKRLKEIFLLKFPGCLQNLFAYYFISVLTS